MQGVNLNFIGYGSGFCPSLGTTSAYYKEQDKMLIIDCGEEVYKALKNSDVLSDVKTVYFIITHTHCDHIGSIGTLIFHLHFIKNININIVLNDNMLYKNDIISYLTIVGVEPQMINIINSREVESQFEHINKLEFVKVEHVKNFVSYAIKITSNNLTTYYTGDSADKQFLTQALTDKNLFRLYTDCTISKRETTHTQFDYLNTIVPNELRNKVYCMHLSHEELIAVCKQNGFQVPTKLNY